MGLYDLSVTYYVCVPLDIYCYTLFCLVLSFVCVTVDAYYHIDEAAHVIYDFERYLYDSGLMPNGVPTLAALLDMAALKNVTQGTFAEIRATVNCSDVIYFFESGCYVGFCHELFHKLDPHVESRPLLYRIYTIYTEAEIESRSSYVNQRAESLTSKYYERTGKKNLRSRNRATQQHDRKLKTIKNVVGNIKQLADAKQNVSVSMFVHVLKYNPRIDKPDDRYVSLQIKL